MSTKPTTWLQRAAFAHIAAHCPEGYEVDLTRLHAISKRLVTNNGICPCHHPEWNESTPDALKECPCHTFREEHHCHCGLYVPKRQ